MNLIEQFNRFNNWAEYHRISPNAQLLWFKLLHIFNLNFWADSLSIPPRILQTQTQYNRPSSLSEARKELVSLGLIEYEAKGTVYRLMPFSDTNTGSTVKKTQKSSKEEKPKKKKRDPLPYSEIVEFWNEHHGNMKEIDRISESRKRKFRVLCKEGFTLDDIKKVILKAEASDYLNGRREGDWKNCNFDWFLNSENFVKTLEGNYDNDSSEDTNQVVPLDDDLYAAYR